MKNFGELLSLEERDKYEPMRSSGPLSAEFSFHPYRITYFTVFNRISMQRLKTTTCEQMEGR